MGSNLYEIDKNLLEFLENGFNEECVDMETGELLADKVGQVLENLQLDRSTKIENVGLYIKNLEADTEAIKIEEENLKARRQAKEKRIDSLKNYLSNSLQLFGQTKFETPRIAMTFRKSVSVEVGDIKELPVWCLKEKLEYVADKAEIKKALQSGEEVSGAMLVEKQNLQIK